MACAGSWRCGFADLYVGNRKLLRVEVKAPGKTHEISVGKLHAWLEGGGKSPHVNENRWETGVTGGRAT